jgi:hypothetical protein
MPSAIENQLNCSQRLQDEKSLGLTTRHLPGRQRTRPGAIHLIVNILIDKVVIGAARTAHGDSADQKQEQVPD